MIIIAGEITVKPETTDDFREKLLAHRENSMAQDGCRGFDIAEVHDTKGVFLVWECYVDEDAFEAHKTAPFMAEFREQTKDLVTGFKLVAGDLLR